MASYFFCCYELSFVPKGKGKKGGGEHTIVLHVGGVDIQTDALGVEEISGGAIGEGGEVPLGSQSAGQRPAEAVTRHPNL